MAIYTLNVVRNLLRWISFRCRPVAAALILLGMSAVPLSMAAPPEPGQGLFQPTALDIPEAGAGSGSADVARLRRRPVVVDFDRLLAPQGASRGADVSGRGAAAVAERLTLNLFPDVALDAVLDRALRNASGSLTWAGHVVDAPLSAVTLVSRDGVMVGDIQVADRLYRVRPAGEEIGVDGLHLVEEVDATTFPRELTPLPASLPPEAPAGGVSAPRSILQDDGSTIDVLVVYTDDARQVMGSTTAIENLIDQALVETNQSYENSGIAQRLNVVHTAEVAYDESGFDWSTTLGRLRGTTDGYMDGIHALRDTYCADEVVLIVSNTASCGRAYIMTTVSAGFEAWAFAVVSYDCATGYYSFGHELGHTMGARHDWFVDDTNNSPYTYNHGYVNYPDRWRTVMAYNDDCDCRDEASPCPAYEDRATKGTPYCSRFAYWSNPGVSYGGDPMGVPAGSPNAADNHLTLDNTAYTVANFRTSCAGTPDLEIHETAVDDDKSNNSFGNSDGFINCGEIAEVYVTLHNTGDGVARDVMGTISSGDGHLSWPWNKASGYPDIGVGSTGMNSDDFDMALSGSTPDGHTLAFTFLIEASGGAGPWVRSFSLPTYCCNDANDIYTNNDTPAQATSISYDMTLIDLDICSPGDQDYYTFYGQTGEVIMVDVDASVDGSLLDPVLYLYGSDVSTPLQVSDDADDLDPFISYTLPANGTYYLKVKDYYANPPRGGADYYYTFDLVGGLGPLSYHRYTVDDDTVNQSSGNGDGRVQCGETIELYVDLENRGGARAGHHQHHQPLRGVPLHAQQQLSGHARPGHSGEQQRFRFQCGSRYAPW